VIHSLPPEQTLTSLIELLPSALFSQFPGFLRNWKHWNGQIGTIDRAIAEPCRQAFTNELKPPRLPLPQDLRILLVA
jgi:hypothetical protein